MITILRWILETKSGGIKMMNFRDVIIKKFTETESDSIFNI